MRLFLYLLILFGCVFLEVAIPSEKGQPYAEQNSLHKKLFHYEILGQKDISLHVRRQRDIHTGHLLVRTHVTFFTLGRNFSVVLKAGSPVLAPGFNAYTVDRHGNKTPFDIDPNDFFTGYLQENESIAVDAHYEDGLLCTTVYFPNETYITEVFVIHFASRPQNSNSSASQNAQYPRRSQSKRKRAASGKMKSCPLRLVADYLFYSRHSQYLAVGAVQSMVSSIQEANRIYQSTTWNLLDSTGWGFAVKQVLVHTEYSVGLRNGPFSYNYQKTQACGLQDVLDDFSRNKDILQFCLAHLFTTYSFQNDLGAAGYAYAGNPQATGGVCSKIAESINETEGFVYPRTSFTTSVDGHSQFITRLQHQLVTAHELGHNWGSLHDPAGRCTPTEEEGGHYLMYTYSVEGNQPNNFRFSSCSIDLISRTLAAVSDLCFIESSEADSVCGNGMVDDKDEECDAGLTIFESQDKCCSSTCTLRDFAECSDFRDPCCRNCTLAKEGTVCQSNFDFQCLQESKCDGLSYACPPPLPAADGTTCLDRGTCSGGRCVTYCEALGESRNKTYTTCLCEHNAIDACMRCCMEIFPDNTKGSCFPTNQSLAYGRRCYNGECNEVSIYKGSCRNGVCVPTEGRFLRILTAFFQHPDFDGLWRTIKTNIVMTVLVLSALIWIPACLLASCWDKRNKNIFSDEESREKTLARPQIPDLDRPAAPHQSGHLCLESLPETSHSNGEMVSEPALTDEETKHEQKYNNDTEQQKSSETEESHEQIDLGSSWWMTSQKSVETYL